MSQDLLLLRLAHLPLNEWQMSHHHRGAMLVERQGYEG